MLTYNRKDEFVTLVHANRKNRHRAVLKAASELFASKSTPAHDEILHFEELCLRLFPKLDLISKAEVAERLSVCSSLPKATALALAKEDISVAAPVLRHYQGFSDDDLLVILANGDELHALAVSTRAHLSDKVILALSHMKLPTFDRPTQVEPAQKEKQARLDLDIEILSANEPEQDTIEDSTDTTINEDTAISADKPPFSSLDKFLAMEHAHILTRVQQIEENAAKSEANPVTILKQAYRRAERATEFVKLARHRQKDKFATLLAHECNLDTEAAKRISNDIKGFALAICLKSLALPVHVANEAFILLNQKRGEDPQQIYLLSWFYSQITPTGAHNVLSQWQDNHHVQQLLTNKRSYKPLHDGKPLSDAYRRPATPRTERSGNQEARIIISNS